MKIYIDVDEWYPCYSISVTTDSSPKWMKKDSIEIDDILYGELRTAMNIFDEVQDKLSKLNEERLKMKRSNQPHRKLARRKSALTRLEKSERVDEKVKLELETLRHKVKHPNLARTKKDRSARGRLTR